VNESNRQQHSITSEETTATTGVPQAHLNGNGKSHDKAADSDLLAQERAEMQATIQAANDFMDRILACSHEEAESAADERFAQRERKLDARYRFLMALYGGQDALPDGRWSYLWQGLPPPQNAKTRGLSTFAQTVSALTALIDGFSDDVNVYIGCTGSEQPRDSNERVKAADFVAAFGVFADLELFDPAHPQKSLPTNDAAMAALIEAIGLAPSMIVSTGHGRHLWWLFPAPLTWAANDTKTRARVRRLFKAWGAHVQAVGRELGYHLDNVSEAARVLRVAGTTNQKWNKDGTPRPEVEVTLNTVNPARYAVEALEDFLHLSGEAEQDAGTGTGTDTSGDPFSESAQFAINIATDVLRQGRRWDRIAPLVGMLAHGGMAEATALRVMGAICDRAKDIDRARELETVRRTYQRKRDGQDHWGATKLAELLGDDWGAVNALKMLFRLSTASSEPITPPQDDIPTSAVAWPDPIAEEGYHGALGTIAHEIEPYIETDTSALLINLIAMAGVMMGRQVYHEIGAKTHRAILNTVTVGETSQNKADCVAPTEAIANEIAARYSLNAEDGAVSFGADPAKLTRMDGLATGEGLLYQVRDRRYEWRENRRTHVPERMMVDEGVEDKRLLVVEEEFARVFTVMGRDGATLSATIRRLYDSPEQASSKPKSAPITATGAHVALIGLITPDELHRKLSEVELTNGFINRFTWSVIKRINSRPNPPRYSEMVGRHAEMLWQALKRAEQVHEVVRDAEAQAEWDEIYEPLREGEEDKPRDGILRDICARAHVHILRVSMVFAALDGSNVITLEHQHAARAIWNYTERAATYLFTGYGTNPITTVILTHLKKGRMTQKQINGLFQRNLPATAIKRALDELTEQGQVRSYQQETGGRPTTWWEYVPAEENEQEEREEASK
jgi:uncharacterized protein DUF3987